MYFQTAIVRKTGHKCHISVVSFHHELLSYAFKVFLSEIFWLHRDIQIFSSFQEHQQYVSLNCSLQKNLVTNITLE